MRKVDQLSGLWNKDTRNHEKIRPLPTVDLKEEQSIQYEAVEGGQIKHKQSEFRTAFALWEIRASGLVKVKEVFSNEDGENGTFSDNGYLFALVSG